MDEKLGSIISNGDVPDGESDIDIPDDVVLPDGARICGLCSGCGEFHFLWDADHHDHIHDVECDHD
jgi:hypothetical protein